MKTPLLFFLVVAGFFVSAQKEVDDSAEWKERIYTGGGGSFGGGNHSQLGKYFTISVNPLVGYMLTENASVGIGGIYQFTSFSDIKVKYSQYAINPFVRYNFGQFFLKSEFNYVNVPSVITASGNAERVFRSRLLFGAGYAVPSGNGFVNVAALYDVLYTQNSPFASPWVFRVFLTF